MPHELFFKTFRYVIVNVTMVVSPVKASNDYYSCSPNFRQVASLWCDHGGVSNKNAIKIMSVLESNDIVTALLKCICIK